MNVSKSGGKRSVLHQLVRCVCVCVVVTCGSRKLCSAFQRYQPVPGSVLKIYGGLTNGRLHEQKESLSALWNVWSFHWLTVRRSSWFSSFPSSPQRREAELGLLILRAQHLGVILTLGSVKRGTASCWSCYQPHAEGQPCRTRSLERRLWRWNRNIVIWKLFRPTSCVFKSWFHPNMTLLMVLNQQLSGIPESEMILSCPWGGHWKTATTLRTDNVH